MLIGEIRLASCYSQIPRRASSRVRFVPQTRPRPTLRHGVIAYDSRFLDSNRDLELELDAIAEFVFHVEIGTWYRSEICLIPQRWLCGPDIEITNSANTLNSLVSIGTTAKLAPQIADM